MSEIIRKETNQRMSRIVIHNETVYLCGQVAKEMVPDVGQQTRTMLEKVDELLASVGTDKTAILSATLYLKEMKDFAGMNEAWEAWVPEGHAPARACVEARMSHDEILVEVSIIASV